MFYTVNQLYLSNRLKCLTSIIIIFKTTYNDMVILFFTSFTIYQKNTHIYYITCFSNFMWFLVAWNGCNFNLIKF